MVGSGGSPQPSLQGDETVDGTYRGGRRGRGDREMRRR